MFFIYHSMRLKIFMTAVSSFVKCTPVPFYIQRFDKFKRFLLLVSFLRGHILHAHLKRILVLVKSRVFVCMTTTLLKVIFWYLSKTLPWMCIFPQSATNHSQKKYRNENRWYLHINIEKANSTSLRFGLEILLVFPN